MDYETSNEGSRDFLRRLLEEKDRELLREAKNGRAGVGDGLELGRDNLELERRNRQRKPNIGEAVFGEVSANNVGYGIKRWNQGKSAAGLSGGEAWIDAHLDPAVLADLIERYSGVSLAEWQEVYRRNGGPLPARLREKRNRLDVVLADLRDAGASVAALLRVLDITRNTVMRALKRAGRDGPAPAKEVRNAPGFHFEDIVVMQSTPPAMVTASWGAYPDERWTLPDYVICKPSKPVPVGEMPPPIPSEQARDERRHYAPPKKRADRPADIEMYHGSSVGAAYCGCDACVAMRQDAGLDGWIIL